VSILDDGLLPGLVVGQEFDDDRRDAATTRDRVTYSTELIGNFDFNGYTFQNVNLGHNALWQALDTMKREMKQMGNDSNAVSVIPVISGSSIALTAGFISWVLRGGALSAALLSTMPMWKGFDPLPLLAARRKDDDKDDDKNRQDEESGSLTKPFEETSANVEQIFSQSTSTGKEWGRKK